MGLVGRNSVALVLALAPPLAARSEAQESLAGPVAAIVALCDVLTSHALDSSRRAQPVADDEIIPGLAVPACEESFSLDPSPINTLQLGRSYLSAGRLDDSSEMFEASAEGGHPVAAGYVGDAYLFGRGVEQDLEKARRYYEMAVAGGFEPAQTMLDAMTFDPSLYMKPLIIGLFNGIEELNDALDLRRSPLVNGYIYSFSTSLDSACGGALHAQSLLKLMELRYTGPVTIDVESTGIFQIESAAGDYDAQAFVQRHACDGPVAEQLIANLSAYVALHR